MAYIFLVLSLDYAILQLVASYGMDVGDIVLVYRSEYSATNPACSVVSPNGVDVEIYLDFVALFLLHGLA